MHYICRWREVATATEIKIFEQKERFFHDYGLDQLSKYPWNFYKMASSQCTAIVPLLIWSTFTKGSAAISVRKNSPYKKILFFDIEVGSMKNVFIEMRMWFMKIPEFSRGGVLVDVNSRELFLKNNKRPTLLIMPTFN